MKREQLSELGLEKQTIDAVMALHGSTVSELNDEVRTLKKQNEQLDEQVESYSQKVEELNNNSQDEDLKAQLQQLEDDNEALKQKQAQDLAEMKRQHKIELAVKGLGTKDEAYIASKLSDLELTEDGNLADFDSRVSELKEQHPLLFEAEETQPLKKWSQGNSTVASGTLTKQDIFNEKDATKRQQLIQQNPHLFE